MRGEYSVKIVKFFGNKELPPHARRIRNFCPVFLILTGTTSACAENTTALGEGKHRIGNYLRMRGEYGSLWHNRFDRPELPPHARRIRENRENRRILGGTTSACAENTLNELGLL